MIDDRRLVYSVRIWNKAITNSLETLNSRFADHNGIIVDLGGGSGPLSEHVNKSRFDYIVVDKNLKSLTSSSSDHQRIFSDITRLPLKDNSVDLAISITCLQYVDQIRFFQEARRILKPDGIMAIHENGKYNPFILLARAIQRCIGVFKHDVWRYRNTIASYYAPKFCPDGYEVVYRTSTCLITPLLFGLEMIGIHSSAGVLRALEKVDAILLKFPPLKKLAFLNIVHFKKISDI